MNKLIDQLENVLPKGMEIPNELKLLYQWIENNELYVDKNGNRYGFLFPEKELKESWTEQGRNGGTDISFSCSGTQNLKYWFGGEDNEKLKTRLCVFAQSGAEGSECALWKTDNNEIKIVHMGSGSGSCLSCVLGDNIVDFIRLLAIGYDEICWNENYSSKPSEISDFLVKPNSKFQKWVEETFNVDIPKTGLEVVKYPATMNDESSKDDFFNWYQKYIK